MTPLPRALFALMLAALLVRLAIWPWFDGLTPRIYDEDDYVDIAINLAERGEFAMNGRITAARPPLYPAVVALVYRVAGVGNHQAVRLLQILLNVAIIPLVFLIGRRLYDDRTALLAAALAAFYPSLWGHDYLLLTEVLFTFLLVAGTWALIENASAERTRWLLLAAAGLAFGLSALTRSSIVFYPPLFAIATFGLSRAPSPRRIATVLLFTVAFAVSLAPWIARNTMLVGRLSSIDSISGFTAAHYSPLRHLFERKGSTWATRDRSQMLNANRAANEDEDEERRNRSGPRAYESAPAEPAPATDGQGGERRAGARPRLEPASPGGNLVRAATGVMWDGLLFWRIDREIAGAAARGWLGPMPRGVAIALTAAIAGYYVLLALAGALGLALRPPSDRLQLAIMLSVIAVLFAVHAASVGHSRYHIPLMPLVAVFAARFWVARREKVAPRRMALGIALSAVLIASWVVAIVRFDLPDVRQRLDGKERRSATESRID